MHSINARVPYQRVNSVRRHPKESKVKLSLSVSALQDAIVLHCGGRIAGRAEGAAFSARVSQLLPGPRHLIVDLHDVEMIDSAGLGELVMILMLVQASGCEVKLAAARPRIQALLEHTNLTAVLDVYPTLEAARLAFSSRVA